MLRETAEGAVRVGAQPDATRVALAATSVAPGAAGTVLFSGTSGELVMVATGLDAPPAGMEYGCWLEIGGDRQRIGKLYPGGDIQSWVGPVDGLAGIPAGLDVRGLARAGRRRGGRRPSSKGRRPGAPRAVRPRRRVLRRGAGSGDGAARSRSAVGSTSVSGGGKRR